MVPAYSYQCGVPRERESGSGEASKISFFASGDWFVKCTWGAHELPRFFVRRGWPQ